MMKKLYPSLGLILLLCCCWALPFSAQAAAPQPETDETVYINLDHYGAVDAIRVVKGVAPNGADALTDYGSYQDVFSMTNHLTPQLGNGSVSWDLSNLSERRFYYECVLQQEAAQQLPWTFDISYQLNGEPVEAMDCAGADGLIEITVHAIPNEAAPEYYRNNLALVVMTGVDMDQTRSIEAPGAQIQAVGNYKMILFMGMPGEEETFTIRIGSDEFESMGVMMMMVPGTLSQLDTIADIKEVKDKVSDAEENLFQGIYDTLNAMNQMQSGISAMSQGLSGIEEVRQALVDSRGTIDPEIDAALDHLQLLAGDSGALVPELNTMKTNLVQFNQDTNAIFNTILSTETQLTEYQDSLEQLEDLLQESENMIDDIQDIDDLTDITNDLRRSLNQLATSSGNLSDDITKIKNGLAAYEDLEKILSDLLDQLAASGAYPELAEQLQGLLNLLSGIIDQTENSLEHMEDLLDHLKTALRDGSDLMDYLSDVAEVLDDYQDLPNDVINLGQDTSRQLQKSLDTAKDLLKDLGNLQTSLDKTADDTTRLLEKSGTMLTSLSETLATAGQALQSLNDTLRSLRATSDTSLQNTLTGMMDVLDEIIANSSAATTMQQASSSIHNLIKDELDQMETDSNLLNMDNSLPLQSFTSSQNPAPVSLQFLLRTEEINPEEAAEAEYTAPTEEETGVFDRIANVFKQLFAAVKEIFSQDN